MGGYETGTLVSVEPSLKYHPGLFEVLTLVRDPDRGQCMVGSLTGLRQKGEGVAINWWLRLFNKNTALCKDESRRIGCDACPVLED